MPDSNCYTFDASTGILNQHIQLEKHISLQVGIEEHNREKKKVRVCQINPPKNFDSKTLLLRSAQLINDHLVEVKAPNEVILHVVGSHRIKPRKDSTYGVLIKGCRTALVQIRKGSGVTINNSNSKWHLHVDRHSMEVQVTPA